MPPFEFQPYENRNLGTIAELMLAAPRARANAARTAGDAQARSALQSGQNAQQLAGTLGGIISGVGQQIGQHYQDKPRREREQLQLSAARDEESARKVQAGIDARIRQQLPEVLAGRARPETLISVAGER